MGIKDLLFRKEQPRVDVCVFSSGDSAPVDYGVKQDRSDQITYDGIGKAKYGTGIPPSVYTNVISAIQSFPIVYGCITAISDSISGLSVKVYQVKGGQEAEVLNHPFYLMFKNPNPYQGSFEFMEQLVQSLDVTGNAFIGLEKVAGTYEMYVLPTKYVAIIPDPKIRVKEYHYYINGKFVVYKPEEIIHIRYSNIDDSYYGTPPLASANDILTFESYRIAFANNFFKNSAIPTGLLETEQVLGDNLLKKLRGEWTNIHGGLSNSHKIGILQGGLKYSPLSSPLKDLDLAGLKRLSKEDIQLIYKIPDSILGNMDGTGSAEGREALAAFWRGSLIPRIRRIESALNRGLGIAIFGQGKQYFKFDLTKVEALQDDKESTAKYLSTLLSASVLSPNEARSVIGMPPSNDPNADKLYISNSNFGNQLIPADQANASANATGTNTEKPTAKPKPTKTPKTT